MAEPTQQNQEPTQDPNSEDPEAGFWKKLSDLVDNRLDEGIERAIKKHVTPNSRNGGRSSFPQTLAKLMGGPFTPVS